MDTLAEKTLGGRPAAYLHGGAPAPHPTLKTLQDVLAERADAERTITYVDAAGRTRDEPLGALVARARELGEKLLGLKRAGQSHVLLHFDAPDGLITAFWACVHAGLTAVPMGPLDSYRRGHPGAEALFKVWDSLERPPVLCAAHLEANLVTLASEFEAGPLDLATPEALRDSPASASQARPAVPAASTDDPALVLFTSGSTGTPKGVLLTHETIISGGRGIAELNGLTEDDVSVNWLSLNHVGGLVMFHVRDVILGCSQVQVATPFVVGDPLRWLDLLERFRATVTWAPNFAYALVNQRLETEDRAWDLSRLRLIGNGAEPINVATAHRFIENLGPSRLPAGVMRATWGTSETCAGTTYSSGFRPGSPEGTVTVAKDSLKYGREVVFCEPGPDASTFASGGRPIPGMEVRIVDGDGRPVAQRVFGSVQVRGNNVIRRYLAEESINRELFQDGWLKIGDLGFVHDGELVVAGREKDVIIINGVNHVNSDVEAVVERVPGVRPSFTIACAVRQPGAETDELAVVFSPSADGPADDGSGGVARQKEAIRRAILEHLGLVPSHIHALRPEDVAKTPIGKLQRSRMASLLGEWLGHHERLAALEWRAQDADAKGPDATLPAAFDEVVVVGAPGLRAVPHDPYRALAPVVRSLREALAEGGAGAASAGADDDARVALVVPPAVADGPRALEGLLPSLMRWLERSSGAAGRLELVVLVEQAAAPGELAHGDDFLVGPAVWSLVGSRARSLGNVDVRVRDAASLDRPESLGASGLGPREAFFAAERDATWHVPVLAPSEPDSASHDGSLRPRPGGRYLVVGGTGGIGTAIVQYLASTGASAITAVARRAREARPSLEEALRQSPFGRQTEPPALSAVDCDLGVPGSHGVLVEALGAEEFDGVVFCAGSWDRLLGDADEEPAMPEEALAEALTMVDEFVQAAEALSPTTTLMIGAVAGQLRGAGTGYYGAANAARAGGEAGGGGQRGGKGGVVLAPSTPRGGKGSSGRRPDLTRGGLFEPVAPEEAVRSLDEALRTGHKTFLLGRPSAAGLAAVARGGLLVPAVAPEYLRRHRSSSAAAGRPDDIAVAVTVPSGEVGEAERVVGEAVGRALGYESVSTEDDFFELGGTSLHVAVVNALLGEQGYRIPPGLFFRGRQVRRLAALLEPIPESARISAANGGEPLHTGRLAIDGGEIHYEYYGTGERTPVVLFNGIAMEAASWRPFLPYLLPGYDVLLWDMRGQGESTSDGARYDFGDVAGYLRGVLDRVGVERPAHLVGVSMGSLVVLEFARRYPERVGRIVISGISLTPPEAEGTHTPEGWLGRLEASPEDWFGYLLSRGFSDRFLGALDRQAFLREGIAALAKRYADRPSSMRRMINAYQDFFAGLSEALPELKRLPHPVLVLAGGADEWTPPSGQRALARVLPDMRYVEYPGVGHLPVMEETDLFFHDALAHLSEASTAP